MVLIDVQIAIAVHRQIKSAVLGKQFQHVIEKTDSSRNVVTPTSLNLQTRLDTSLLGVPFDRRLPHSTLSISLMFSIIATAFSSSNSFTRSARRECDSAAIPMKGTPAARA